MLLSRQMENGDVAFGAFLVDVYCLGVKNAMSDILPRTVYDRKVYARMAEQGEVVRLRPELAANWSRARSGTRSIWGFRRTGTTSGEADFRRYFRRGLPRAVCLR